MKENEITDEVILQKYYSTSGRIIGTYTSTKWLNEHPEFKNYLENRFDDSESIRETIFRIKEKIEKRPTCPVCGNPVKFQRCANVFNHHCSRQCVYADPNTRSKREATCLEKYECIATFQSEDIKTKSRQTCLNKYGVTNGGGSAQALEKIHKTWQEKYGVDNISQLDWVKEKKVQTCQQHYNCDHYLQSAEGKANMKQVCLDKYGVEYISQNEEIKQKIIESNRKTWQEKEGVDWVFSSKAVQQKAAETKIERYGTANTTSILEINHKIYLSRKKNKTLNSSKIEKEFEQYLINRGLKYKAQMKSEQYPFNCDFYLCDYNLYVEIQGNWTHGFHPFDSTNQDDIDKLCYWKQKNTKFYNGAIETWTQRDVMKRHHAQKNNLKYLEIFSMFLDDCIQALEDKLKTLEQG